MPPGALAWGRECVNVVSDYIDLLLRLLAHRTLRGYDQVMVFRNWALRCDSLVSFPRLLELEGILTNY